MLYNRRKFILSCLSGLVLGFISCRKSFKPKPKIINLGDVRDLLKARQYINGVAMVVFRDEKGWSAMSGLCSYDGCELTNLEAEMVCPCCRSHFNLLGHVIFGSARQHLPWYMMSYDNGRLYANTAEEVDSSVRFVHPTIEEKVRELIKEIKEHGIDSGVKIPEGLSGADKNLPSGSMFIERRIEEPND